MNITRKNYFRDGIEIQDLVKKLNVTMELVYNKEHDNYTALLSNIINEHQHAIEGKGKVEIDAIKDLAHNLSKRQIEIYKQENSRYFTKDILVDEIKLKDLLKL